MSSVIHAFQGDQAVVGGTAADAMSFEGNTSAAVKSQKNVMSGMTMADIETHFPFVPKYEISRASYEKRPDSALQFLKSLPIKQNEASFDASSSLNLSTRTTNKIFNLGDRVIVSPGYRLGTVRYVGPIVTTTSPLQEEEDSKGLNIWIGVELDLPNGKNDGSIEDVGYFSCPPSHGLFVKPKAVALLEEDDDKLSD